MSDYYRLHYWVDNLAVCFIWYTIFYRFYLELTQFRNIFSRKISYLYSLFAYHQRILVYMDICTLLVSSCKLHWRLRTCCYQFCIHWCQHNHLWNPFRCLQILFCIYIDVFRHNLFWVITWLSQKCTMINKLWIIDQNPCSFADCEWITFVHSSCAFVKVNT